MTKQLRFPAGSTDARSRSVLRHLDEHTRPPLALPLEELADNAESELPAAA